MTLSAEELEIVAYLNSCPRQFVSMAEINRRAGGKSRFNKSPAWARGLLARLVDAGLVVVDDRGRYRAGGVQPTRPTEGELAEATHAGLPEIVNLDPMVLGDDYFPANSPSDATPPVAENRAAPRGPQIIGDDYFPATD